MSISRESGPDGVILRVEVQTLSGDAAQELKQMFTQAVDAGEKNVTIDLGPVEFIDSSGLGKLLFMYKKLDKLGGKLTVSRVRDGLYAFLESLAITEVMEVRKG